MLPSHQNSLVKAKSNVIDPLRGIELSQEKQNKILLETVGAKIFERIPLFGGLINFFQTYRDKIDAAKLAVLWEKLREKMQSQEQFTEAINRILSSNTGLNLFQKIFKILNKDHFDPEFVDLLASCLKNMSVSDLDKMFEELNYTLSQIERISVQALIILSKHQFWNGVRLERATNMSGQLIAGDWDNQVSNHFAAKIGMSTDKKGIERLAHTFRELQANGLTMLNNQTRSVDLTEIGKDVFELISV